MTPAERDAKIEAARTRAGGPSGPPSALERALFDAGYEAAATEPAFAAPPWFAQYAQANMEASALRARLES